MVKPEAVQAPEPVIFHQEKEISLDDDNDDDFLTETETPAALAPSEPVIFHEEKEISLDDDDDEPQYEEEKLQVNKGFPNEPDVGYRNFSMAISL